MSTPESVKIGASLAPTVALLLAIFIHTIQNLRKRREFELILRNVHIDNTTLNGELLLALGVMVHSGIIAASCTSNFPAMAVLYAANFNNFLFVLQFGCILEAIGHNLKNLTTIVSAEGSKERLNFHVEIYFQFLRMGKTLNRIISGEVFWTLTQIWGFLITFSFVNLKNLVEERNIRLLPLLIQTSALSAVRVTMLCIIAGRPFQLSKMVSELKLLERVIIVSQSKIGEVILFLFKIMGIIF